MNSKHEIRHLFLQQFVKYLIKNSEKKGFSNINFQQNFPQPSVEKEKPEVRPTINNQSQDSILEKSVKARLLAIPPVSHRPKNDLTLNKKGKNANSSGPKKQTSLKEMQPSLLRASGKIPSFSPKQNSGKTITRVAPGKIELGKINVLITDPRVQGLECIGPNKKILVKKDGTTLVTKISLTKEEIKKLISSFSEKARVPLIGGTFKAALGNLIITAITSDFVGDRFIIQKRNPFQPLKF